MVERRNCSATDDGDVVGAGALVSDRDVVL